MSTLYILLSILTFCLGFTFGRNYKVIKRSRLSKASPDTRLEDIEDIMDDLKDTLTPPRSRIISPSHLRREKEMLKDFEEN